MGSPENISASPPKYEGIVRDIIRFATRKRLFSSIGKKAELTVKEVANKDDFLYGQWMSLILLSGPDLQVTLKAHYSNTNASRLVAMGLGKSEDSLAVTMIMDFMREFCNLAAGEIKSYFANDGISIGLSLPLITRGFDEVLFSDGCDERSVRDWWKLAWANGEIICSSEIEVLQPKALKDITPISEGAEEESADEGDVDFL